MESVEEMCDEIALIHNSNKLLDGSLIDIKKQYRSNTFDVGIIVSNPQELMHNLKEKYELNHTTFKSLDEELQFSASRSEEHTSELQSRPHLVCRLLLEKKKHDHSFISSKRI